MERISPLTGHLVAVRTDSRLVHTFDDVCGSWSVTEEADPDEGVSITGGRLQTDQRTLSEKETRRAFSLGRSLVWRAQNIDGSMPLFMTARGAESFAGQIPSRTKLLTFEAVSDAAARLTLEEKALTTLENLTVWEEDVGTGVDVPYLLSPFPGEPSWGPSEPPEEIGVTHGATSNEAPLIYGLLLDRGLVRQQDDEPLGERGTKVFITPEGYASVARLQQGRSDKVRQAFFVCRFIPELDHLYDTCIEPTGREADLACPIRRVKDVHHNDRIDDRICREIERATVVLVDLTKANFNVAFEAGYALALGKPIVWTKKKGATLKMPFDIYTYNCLSWDPSDLDEFKRMLRFRLLAALEKSGLAE